ncbi:MAG: UDP-2,3-diacylglucosamine diphosphatase LpxI domain-containing protein, partial [Kiritimatiellia bacterium]
SEGEFKDIQVGHSIALDICDLDIGQTILVKAGMVLAVEAFEGTNEAIRRGGKLGGGEAYLLKWPRRTTICASTFQSSVLALSSVCADMVLPR